MQTQMTLSIIKPCAVSDGFSGAINAMIERAGFRIVAQRMIMLTQKEAQEFYKVHSARPFFASLVSHMTSGPVIVQVLAGQNAIADYRELMGATDPKNAQEGTIRASFARNIEENAVHGSDSPENAAEEISFFFAAREICSM